MALRRAAFPRRFQMGFHESFRPRTTTDEQDPTGGCDLCYGPHFGLDSGRNARLDDPARPTRCAKCFDANGPRGGINPLARFEEDAVTGVLNVAEDLESHRTYLLRVARLQL